MSSPVKLLYDLEYIVKSNESSQTFLSAYF